MHSSRCVPPAGSLRTVLGFVSGEGTNHGAVTALAPIGIAGMSATHYLVVSNSGPSRIGLTLVYDGAGTADVQAVTNPVIWLDPGLSRVALRARVRAARVQPDPLADGSATRPWPLLSYWPEEIPMRGPFPSEGTEPGSNTQ